MKQSIGKPVLLLCLLLLLGAFGGASAQNLIANGDFSGPVVPVSLGTGGGVGENWTAFAVPADAALAFWCNGSPVGFTEQLQRVIMGVTSSSTELYNGGIVQAVATTPGTVYDLDFDAFLYADRGSISAQVPAPNSFLLKGFYGYDLTGQTTNSGASTIVWSDQEKVWNSNTWAHYHARFQATGGTVSIWFKAERNHNWGYLDIDNVVLQPAGDATLINNYDPVQPALRNPSFEDSDIALGPDRTTATISWITDVPCSGAIEYGPTGPNLDSDTANGVQYLMSQVQSGPAGNEHSITLTGLTPDSTYHFRLVNSAVGAKTAVSRDFTLSTAAVETGIPNPTLRPWIPFEVIDHSGSYNGTGIFGPAANYGVTAKDGSYYLAAFASYEKKSGGLYQRVSAIPGARYSLKADFLTYVAPSTYPTDDMVFIAIDPLGGTDMYAPSVVWNGDGRGKHCFDPMQQDCGVGAFNSPVAPAWNNNIDNGLGNPTEVTAVAQANAITVFVYIWQKWGLQWNTASADNLRLVRTDPANVPSIGAARQEYDSTIVNITNAQVVTLVPISDTGFFYAQDPEGNAGIRVEPAGGSLPSLGANVSIINGLLATNADGERVLRNATVTVTGGSATTKLRTTINRAIGGGGYVEAGGSPAVFGLTNQGLLLKVFGRVTKVDYASDYFLMDDGSAVDAQDTAAGIKVIRTGLLPIEGQYVSVLGVVSAEKVNGKQIRVLRGREDFGELVVLD